jgi:hypothetical protein
MSRAVPLEVAPLCKSMNPLDPAVLPPEVMVYLPDVPELATPELSAIFPDAPDEPPLGVERAMFPLDVVDP